MGKKSKTTELKPEHKTKRPDIDAKKYPKSKYRSNTGRPTKYDPKYCDQIIDYFDRPLYEEVDKDVVTKQGDVVTIKVKEPIAPATLAMFALEIGISYQTLCQWRAAHDEFRDAVNKAKAFQERMLFENGLSGRYDKTLSIFSLKNLSNWKDRQEVTHEGKFSLESALTKTIEDNTKQLDHDPNSEAVEAEYTEVDDSE